VCVGEATHQSWFDHKQLLLTIFYSIMTYQTMYQKKWYIKQLLNGKIAYYLFIYKREMPVVAKRTSTNGSRTNVSQYFRFLLLNFFLLLKSRGGKTGMPGPFRPTPFKPTQKRGGAGRANLGVRVQNSSPPVYWRGCGLAGMPAKYFFFFFYNLNYNFTIQC
jgi:hypothetical protein